MMMIQQRITLLHVDKNDSPARNTRSIKHQHDTSIDTFEYEETSYFFCHFESPRRLY